MTDPTFLESSPTAERKLRAIARNHTRWFKRMARVNGGEAGRQRGATWIYGAGSEGEVILAFPRWRPAEATAQIEALLEFARARQPCRVICWSLLPVTPADLAARLTARGFHWNWQPHWMWMDLAVLPDDPPLPAGLEITSEESVAAWDVTDLPYYSPADAVGRYRATRGRPRRVWHFAARLDGRVVGHSTVHITTGPLGVAGIYNVGVVPAARNRGVGRAVVLAACRQARRMGCRHASLNATGERMYRQVGFDSLGYGQTWLMDAATLAATPPTPEQVAFAEAIGRGDLAALTAMDAAIDPQRLDAPLTCGMTPVQLAVKLGRPAAVEWLVARGATLDILSAWDLGWHDRAPALLAERPELANLREGDWQITPLHEAVSRGDIELARLLLAADPDLDLQDTEFHSTPLGWAQFFKRSEIVAMIHRHVDARAQERGESETRRRP